MVDRMGSLSGFGQNFRFGTCRNILAKIDLLAETAILAEITYFSRNNLLFGTFRHNFRAEISLLRAEIDLFWPKEGYFGRNAFFRFLSALSVIFGFRPKLQLFK